MHFSLFPTSDLLFSPFKTFSFFCRKYMWIKPKTSMFMDFTLEHIVSRHLKINVEALVLFLIHREFEITLLRHAPISRWTKELFEGTQSHFAAVASFAWPNKKFSVSFNVWVLGLQMKYTRI